MRFPAAFTAPLAALFLAFTPTSPALAQDAIVKALDFEELRTVSTELGFTLTDEGVDPDGDYYFEMKSDAGLLFYLYGNGCSDEDPAVGCLGLNMVATFTLNGSQDLHEVMDSISYSFMKIYRSGDDIKASRYLIFDGGITRANMKENLTVFAQIADAIWEQLTDLKVLAD